MGLDELRVRLRLGDYEFLQHLPYNELTLSDIQQLHPGGAYYVGLILRSLQMQGAARDLLETAVAKAPSPWNEMAALELIPMISDPRRLQELVSVIERRLPRVPSVALAAAAAWYRLGDVDRFAAELDRAQRYYRVSSDPRWDDPVWQSYRKLSVLASIDVAPDWQEQVFAFYRDLPAGLDHIEVWRAFEGMRTGFTSAETALMAGSVNLAADYFAGAVEDFDEAIEVGGAELLSPWLVRNIGRAYERAGRYTAGAELLLRAVPGATGNLAVALHEWVARLYRGAAMYEESLGHFGQGGTIAHGLMAQDVPGIGAEDVDRILWLGLDAAWKLDVAREPQGTTPTDPTQRSRALINYLSSYGRYFQDPQYFDDRLDSYVGYLIRRNRWDDVWQAYLVVREIGSDEAIAQYEFVLSVLFSEGLLTPARDPETGRPNREVYLESAASRLGADFHGRIAQALYYGDLRFAAEPEHADVTLTEPAAGYVAFGLVDEATELLRGDPDVRPEDMKALAITLRDRGRIPDSIRAGAIYRLRYSPEMDIEMARLLYPQAFSYIVHHAATVQGVEPYFLFGLMRQESLFDPDIVSHAGAIGLGQIMPTTAVDIAERMGTIFDDLTEPETNAQMSAWYLNNLTKSFESPALAMLAYNAGMGRVRSWLAEYDELPMPLFFEVVPFDETRRYLRHVTEGALLYAHFEGDVDVRQAATGLLPELENLVPNP